MKQSIKSNYFVVLILILLGIFWIWWIPGPRVANDFSFVSQDFLKLQFDWPRAWNERGAEGLGEYGIFTLWSYPVSFIFGALTTIGLNFEIWERILIVLYIFLGPISIWKLLDKYYISNKSKFIGSLFYLVNTYPILLIDGGQISIALAYGIFPLVFLFVSEAVYSNLTRKIFAGLLVTVLGFFDIRFIYILFLLLLIKAFFDIFLSHKQKLLNGFTGWISSGLIIGFIVLGLNYYWLSVQIKTPLDQGIFNSITKISDSFVTVGHALLDIAPHWYKNVFGRISQLRAEFILIPVLVFLAPVLKRQDKNILFWVFVALCSIFLTKGGSEPLSFVYPWLHRNIPGFSLFRDSTKFFFLVNLSFTVLISATSDEILKYLSGKKKLAFTYILFVSIYLLYLIRPVLLNQMTGTFSIQPQEKEFLSLSSVLKEDKNFGRVFWIPGTEPLTYSDLNHPVIEAARVFNRKPFVFGTKGAYETFNFLREAQYMGEIFDIAGIAYISYPFLNPKRDDLSLDHVKYYYTFLNQLTNLPWVKERNNLSKVPLLETKVHQDKIFITDNTWIVFGTDEIFNEAAKDAQLKLANNAIIFGEQKSGMGSLISQLPEAKIVLNGKTQLDLLATFIPEAKIIFPSKQLSIKPDINGWWKNDGVDFISWRDFLQSKYGIDNKDFDLGGGWAVSEKSSELRINSSELKKDSILLTRVMESSRSGSVRFYQNEELIGLVKTQAKENIIRWFKVGVLTETADLIIKTEGDINVVNALALVSQKDLDSYEREAGNLGSQIKEYKPENAEKNNSSISFQRINQTKYKIKILNLTHPEMIVFSSSFHYLWKLNGQNAISVYGFLNGFRVEENGVYILEFEPQKDLETGLIVSFLTFVFLIIIFSRLNSKAN